MASTPASLKMRHLNGSSSQSKSHSLARNQTPSPGPQPDAKIVGSWLCDEGPYQKYIEALSGTNPGLRKADPNNAEGPLKRGNAVVVLLDSAAAGQPDYRAREAFDSSAKLQRHFDGTTHRHKRRRIYIMEGLAPDFVKVLGGHFFMEPTFFQRQERTCVWSNDFTPVSDALPQPSLLNPERSFHLQYCELRQFNKALENRYYFCERTRRHVGMTAPRHKEETTTGILRRKVSWWCRETAGGGWDVVILCDPQLQHLSGHPKEVVNGQHRPIENVRENLKNAAFQDGYAEFIPPRSFDSPPTDLDTALQDINRTAHKHDSVLQDLIYYYKHHSHLLTDDEWKAPQKSAIFLQKIVAAHYLQLVDYIKVMLPSLELKLTTAWVEEQDQWRSLQTISRRCGNYRDDMEDNLLSLGYPLDSTMGCISTPSPRSASPWKDAEKDLQYVYFRLQLLKSRADALTTSMTGLASIAGNRQALEEAKRVKRLNLLALLFIPLAYTSSLFSMQDNYAPNKHKFWVYWVSAIGAVGVTSVVTFVLDRALDDEAQWTLAPVRWLKFWGGEREGRGMQKRKTGLFDGVRR